MIRRRNLILIIILTLAAGMISSSLTAAFITKWDRDVQFETIGQIIQAVMEEAPEGKQDILSALKHYKEYGKQSDENILVYYGYESSDFLSSALMWRKCGLFAGIGGMAGIFLLLSIFWYWRRGNAARIDSLTEYLSKVNQGNAEIIPQNEEDDLVRLQDEIYKTVTALNQTKNAAVKAKEGFAENLANIAHQLKTPVTALSLSVQMIKEMISPTERNSRSEKYLEQMKRQISRLTYLEEALLLLARIDAGTLSLKHEPIDIFTALTLAAENMEELTSQAGVSVDIPEAGTVEIIGDMEWTMEAIMNLLKNCTEHTPRGGTVHCFYEQNPLYVEIRIWDEGEGFERKDLPHIFERFYRGSHAADGGIGIGLAFAKELIEMQNGIVSAENVKGGGACFDIRFYSH